MMPELIDQPAALPSPLLAAEPGLPTLTLSTCSYRGEGNANLVLALPEKGVIVRLRKCPSHEAAEPARIFREVEFCRKIMQPLLGDECVVIPDVVWIPLAELARLKDLLKNVRPAYRHHKSVFSQYAAVFPDLCLLPSSWHPNSRTFCVEVKPKQAWIPVPDRRLPKCTFCLNQYLKLCHGSISKQSQYCPLDLFSGDETRMKTAIRALVLCPQNNFRIFCDGTLIYGDGFASYLPALRLWFGSDKKEEELLENVCSVVFGALTADGCKSVPRVRRALPLMPLRHAPHTIIQSSSASHIPQQLLDEASALLTGNSCFRPAQSQSVLTLHEDCILNRILQVQKLDVSGSDEALRSYNASPSTDYDYVTSLINDSTSMEESLHCYLVATTAKDCSIMVTFQEATDLDRNRNIVYDSNESAFVFNIGVTDLDPKPLSCIEKHRKRDLEIIQSCINWLKPRRAHDGSRA